MKTKVFRLLNFCFSIGKLKFPQYETFVTSKRNPLLLLIPTLRSAFFVIFMANIENHKN